MWKARYGVFDEKPDLLTQMLLYVIANGVKQPREMILPARSRPQGLKTNAGWWGLLALRGFRASKHIIRLGRRTPSSRSR